MKIYWKNSVVGAELVLDNEQTNDPERVLGAVEIAHGYAFGWAYNSLGKQIFLPSLFSEKIELAKKNVCIYLTHIGIIPSNTNSQSA